MAAAVLVFPSLIRAAELTADAIIAESAVHGGLAVVINSGDGRLVAGLGKHASFCVHDLEQDQAAVAKARAAIKAASLYGQRVSVDLGAGSHLPYVDNVVKLLIVADGEGCRLDEVMRVLAPGGVVITHASGRWQKTVKPWPKTIDQWTHHMHAPDGNLVADDTVVAPPNHLQWVASPDWSREHRYVMHSAMVSAQGRNIYVANEVPVETLDSVPDQMVLVARDAFSGVLLWKERLEDIGKIHVPEPAGRELQLYNPDYPMPLKMAAVGDTLYAAFGHQGAIVGVDAASGAILRKYAHTENTEELICDHGRLLAVIDESDAAGGDKKSGKKFGKWVFNLDFSRVNNNTSLKKYRGTCLRTIDTTSGAVAWEYHAGPPSRIVLSPVIRNDRVFLACGTTLLCLDFVTGKPLWSRPLPAEDLSSVQFTKGPTVWDRLIACSDVLLLTYTSSRTEIHAFAANDGKPLWTTKARSPERSGSAVYVVGETVWCGTNPLLGLDLHSGEKKSSLDTTKVYDVGHHHRCYGNWATTNFLLTGRRGVEFTGFDGGDIHLYHWLRGECRFGILPCNGLLYTTPHGCSCYYPVSYVGYGAFAGKWADEGSAALENELRTPGRQRLTRGSAYAAVPSGGDAGFSPGNWATFRGNNQRSNYAPVDLCGIRLKPAWRATAGVKPSALSISASRLYVADKDGYEIRALDANRGQQLWSFLTGAAVDSPPTIYDHLVLFRMQ
jgi:outer membrane protein assembly factor BamB